jgi:hypothetical protein
MPAYRLFQRVLSDEGCIWYGVSERAEFKDEGQTGLFKNPIVPRYYISVIKTNQFML